MANDNPLTRVQSGKILAGVCTGIAVKYDLDPVLVRVFFVLGGLMGGPAILAYIVCLVVMPSDPNA